MGRECDSGVFAWVFVFAWLIWILLDGTAGSALKSVADGIGAGFLAAYAWFVSESLDLKSETAVRILHSSLFGAVNVLACLVFSTPKFSARVNKLALGTTAFVAVFTAVGIFLIVIDNDEHRNDLRFISSMLALAQLAVVAGLVGRVAAIERDERVEMLRAVYDNKKREREVAQALRIPPELAKMVL